ncbi:MAG: DUF2062 domain-containing protein [Paracoccus sp. (in: a-proteobacteria)]|uniref:DUF2062 domain-containing protein n=1 Tax=Paracoccus sp. TaxID=267 RepID=UPI0026DF3B50|nr:DUF2062 domain-containing protein [Paracoccus sp. (in: a-proteobacteria)]MDO5632725.1 DUF2062 domain-containing protein [Paracoccus sp. (in: a-proteobacteria)]
MFKRKPRSYGQMASNIVYPRGGWRRAALYVMHRMQRLPDQPHRIGRGFAAGVYVSFTPLFGLHFLLAAAIAWLIRGNIIASALGTFVGNPVTFPLIAVISIGLGRYLLGVPGDLSPQMIFYEFSSATGQLWHNFQSLFGPETAHWDRLSVFYYNLFLPYTVGGLIIGIPVALAFHYLTVPIFRAYQRRRSKAMAKRIARATRNAQKMAPTDNPPPPPPAAAP